MIEWPKIRLQIREFLIGALFLLTYWVAINLLCGDQGCGEWLVSDLALIGLAGGLLLSLRAAFNLMKAEPRLVFTPLVAYAASTALFFCFGPMSTFLASEATLRFQENSAYPITPNDVLRTSMLSTFGLAVSLAAILFVLPGRPAVIERPRFVLSLPAVAFVFIVSGLIIKHLIIMPSVYGTSNYFVPGMLRNLRYLPDIGFALAALIAARGNRKWLLIFCLVWPWHFLLAFPEFSKKSVMMTMLLPAMGAFIGNRSFKGLLIWVASAFFVFSVLQNANAIARWEESRAVEYGIVLDVSDRFELLANTTFTTVDVNEFLPLAKQGVETWWLRLNYSGPQSAAMELYDSGFTSTFTQNVLIYVVPRLLWPNKPVLVSPGREFHSVWTGNSDTRTRVGITIFADGYFKLGWLGVALYGAFMGLVFGLFARLTVSQLASNQYLYLPAALLGLQMGATSTTAFLQNSIISALPVYFGYSLVVYCIYRYLAHLKKKRRPMPRHRDMSGQIGEIRT